jgi:hypothetical protein
VYPRLHRYPQLRPDPICTAHEDGVFVSRRLQVEDPAESANFGVGAWSLGGAHEGLDGFDQGVASVDGNAGLGVG